VRGGRSVALIGPEMDEPTPPFVSSSFRARRLRSGEPCRKGVSRLLSWGIVSRYGLSTSSIPTRDERHLAVIDLACRSERPSGARNESAVLFESNAPPQHGGGNCQQPRLARGADPDRKCCDLELRTTSLPDVAHIASNRSTIAGWRGFGDERLQGDFHALLHAVRRTCVSSLSRKLRRRPVLPRCRRRSARGSSRW
jgi:hypothetical protein